MDRIRPEKKHPQKENSFDRVKNIIEKVNGFEGVKTLNRYARQITQYYQLVTLGELQGDSYRFVKPEDLFEGEQKMKVADLFEAIRMGDFEANDIVFRAFRGQSIFHPLFMTIVENFDGIDINRAANLMYLYNKIDNPMQGATKVTYDFYNKASSASKDKINFREVTKVQKQRVLTDINELVVAALVDKCAWSYFGSVRAENILKLLLDPHYGPILFQDFFKLAADENRKILAPPQILGILLQISKDIYGDETRVFSNPGAAAQILKDFYDKGKSLVDYRSNYSITSLDRVSEYDLLVFPGETELHRIIRPEFCDGSILSIGGSIGLEALRVFKFKNSLQSPVMIIDPLGYKKALETALILEHEYKYKDGEIRMPNQLIENRLKAVPGGMLYLNEKAPITFSQIINKLQKAETPFVEKDERKTLLERFSGLQPKIIFDQRTTGIYLEDQATLDSIHNSLQIISGGGVYFFTRGYADKLIIDQVVEVSPKTGKVSLRHLHTTEPYLYSDPKIATSITGTGLAVLFYRYPYSSNFKFNNDWLEGFLERKEVYLFEEAQEKVFFSLFNDSKLDKNILYPFIQLMGKKGQNINLDDLETLAKDFMGEIRTYDYNKALFPVVISRGKTDWVTQDWCLKIVRELLGKWQIANELANDKHAEIKAKIIRTRKEEEDRLTFIDRIAKGFKKEFVLSSSDESCDFTNILLSLIFGYYGISYPITLQVDKDGKTLMPVEFEDKQYIFGLISQAISAKIYSIESDKSYDWSHLEPLSGSSAVPYNVVNLINALQSVTDSQWKSWMSYFDLSFGQKSHQAAD